MKNSVHSIFVFPVFLEAARSFQLGDIDLARAKKNPLAFFDFGKFYDLERCDRYRQKISTIDGTSAYLSTLFQNIQTIKNLKETRIRKLPILFKYFFPTKALAFVIRILKVLLVLKDNNSAMRAKKEYSDHFDFNMMKKFNLNFQARLLNVVIVFDTKKKHFFFRFETFA